MTYVTVRIRSVVWFLTGVVVAMVMVIAFMNGWRADAANGDESAFVPVTPCRLLDTRQPGETAFTSGETRILDAHGTHGACTLPADAVGLSMNVTALDATHIGTYLTIWPDQEAQPNASSLNPSPGQPPIPNAVTTPLSAAGRFKVFNFTGSVQVIIDVNGYYSTTPLAELHDRVARLEAKLASVSAVTVDGKKTVRFSGVNVQVVDGTTTTQCGAAGFEACNGLGNVILGYGEQTVARPRTGSHNLVIGPDNDWTSHSGLVAGDGNAVGGEFATVTGGYSNTASGYAASVSGGYGNTADGHGASVSGGYDNLSDGHAASVSGGYDDTASGHAASVTGGWDNVAGGHAASVSGGNKNEAPGKGASVSGGFNNTANGGYESVAGGDNVTCSFPNQTALCGEGSIGPLD